MDTKLSETYLHSGCIDIMNIIFYIEALRYLNLKQMFMSEKFTQVFISFLLFHLTGDVNFMKAQSESLVNNSVEGKFCSVSVCVGLPAVPLWKAQQRSGLHSLWFWQMLPASPLVAF